MGPAVGTGHCFLDPGHSCTEELLERMARKPTVCESEVRAVGGRGQAGEHSGKEGWEK